MRYTAILRRASLFIAVVLLLCAVSVSIGRINAMPLDEPLLFYNDSTWAREDRSPLKMIEGEYYVPLIIFAQLSDAKVRVNNSLNTFVVSHNDLYISFDATTGVAINQEGTYFYARTYTLDYGERYVPAVLVCDTLEYGYEIFTNETTNKTAFRITDLSEELSFNELLALYNPRILKNETQSSNTDNTDQSTSESSSSSQSNPHVPEKVLGNRIIYITVGAGINAYTGSILDIFSAYGYDATFFIDKDDITDYPLTLARILAEGHKLAIKPDTDDVGAYASTEAFLDELRATNELLYRVYKVKSSIVRPDSLAYSNDSLSSDISSGVLEQNGYTVWNTTLDRVDGIKSVDDATDHIIDAIWKNNTLVIDFGSNYASPSVLAGTLAFIAENADKCDVRLADAPYNPPVR